MNRVLSRHLTYANVVSTLALAVALGLGSAYAASQLGPKTVGAKQLRPGAVTADKIRKHAVTAPKLEALAVKKGKIANGAISAEKLAAGAVIASKLPNEVVSTEKIAADAVTGAKVNEASLGQVPSANLANFATTAATANPEAFAKVSAEGTVFPGDSKGIGTADVKQGKVSVGTYCIAVPFLPKGAQVTPEYNGHNQVSAYVHFGGSIDCDASQAEVQTYSAGSHQKEPFFVVFYR
jgi:hypothetical protein